MAESSKETRGPSLQFVFDARLSDAKRRRGKRPEPFDTQGLVPVESGSRRITLVGRPIVRNLGDL